ncbi:MAG: PhzF family phenazine biosynthesis protein [Gemmatimonadota bacterium]
MMKLEYHLLDVFTRTPFGGNQLAVFPDADDLSDDVMQVIARELNLSESIFLGPLMPDGRVRARIFTPAMELSFAGHPTVGAGALLAQLHEPTAQSARFVLQERVGPIEVMVRREGAAVFSELAVSVTPSFDDVLPPDLPEILSLDESDIRRERIRPRAASVGVAFLMIPVRDIEALRRARVNLTLWERHLSQSGAPHLYVFAPSAEAGYDFQARMFAPALNIVEDPATGAAAAALAAYLADAAESDGSWQWRVAQGVELGRSSELFVRGARSHGVISDIRVGGYSVLVGRGTLMLPGGAN